MTQPASTASRKQHVAPQTSSAKVAGRLAEWVARAGSADGARQSQRERASRPRNGGHRQHSQLVARGSRGRRRRWAKCEKKNIFPVPPSLSLPPFKSNEDPYQYLRLLRCCYHLATSLQNCQCPYSPETSQPGFGRFTRKSVCFELGFWYNYPILSFLSAKVLPNAKYDLSKLQYCLCFKFHRTFFSLNL